MSDLQYVTTHNAYHIVPDAPVLDFVRKTRRRMPAGASVYREIAGHDCTAPALTEQLRMGVRAFELDIHDDPPGGRFTKPAIYADLPPEVVRELPAFDPSGDLSKPGLKTFHQTDFDMRRLVLPVQGVPRRDRQMAQGNPPHLPLFILVELKPDAHAKPVDGDPEQVWSRLHDSILSAFDRADLIAPSDLGHNPVRWPSIAAARGKVVFLLFDYGDQPQERYAAYVAASGAQPLLHIEKDIGGLRRTWESRNDPSTLAQRSSRRAPAIDPDLLLYTKADTAGILDPGRRNRALSSPATFIATDFLTPYRQGSDYSVSFAVKYTRLICNR